MTIDEARTGLKRLQASYKARMSPLDELTVAAYLEHIGPLHYEDFCAGMATLVKTSKFFPTVAEIIEATNFAAMERFRIQDREEREERLAIQAAEEKIMDPKSEIHREPIGPNHKIFLEYLNGTRTFPEPEWMTRKRAKA